LASAFKLEFEVDLAGHPGVLRVGVALVHRQHLHLQAAIAQLVHGHVADEGLQLVAARVHALAHRVLGILALAAGFLLPQFDRRRPGADAHDGSGIAAAEEFGPIQRRGQDRG
jgi:hypothetical protein